MQEEEEIGGTVSRRDRHGKRDKHVKQKRQDAREAEEKGGTRSRRDRN